MATIGQPSLPELPYTIIPWWCGKTWIWSTSFYLLSVHFEPYVGYVMENTKGKHVHHFCGQSCRHIRNLLYLFVFFSIHLLVFFFFFFPLIKKPKNPCRTEGDDEEAKLRSGPAMFSLCDSQSDECNVPPPGCGEGSHATVYKNTSGIRATP